MSCDICGRRILGKPNLVVVEGAKVTTCTQCASLGKPFREPSKAGITSSRPRPASVTRPSTRSLGPTATLPKYVEEYELIDNHAELIKKTRAKLGLSQEELSMRVKERVSIIQKIEIGKMIPDTRLSRELEHVLRIKLLVPSSEPLAVQLPKSSGDEPTLGDIARIREKKSA